MKFVWCLESSVVRDSLWLYFHGFKWCIVPYSLKKFGIYFINFILVLSDFGLSTDGKFFYAILNQKILNFYRLRDSCIIAEYPLYCSPTFTVCSNQFITMAMGDRKIISMLICDIKTHSSKQITERINSLSRRIPVKKDSPEAIEMATLQSNLMEKSQKIFKSNKNTMNLASLFHEIFGIEIRGKKLKDNKSQLFPKDSLRKEGPLDDKSNAIRKTITPNEYIETFIETLDNSVNQLQSNWHIQLLKQSEYMNILKLIKRNLKEKINIKF